MTYETPSQMPSDRFSSALATLDNSKRELVESWLEDWKKHPSDARSQIAENIERDNLLNETDFAGFLTTAAESWSTGTIDQATYSDLCKRYHLKGAEIPSPPKWLGRLENHGTFQARLRQAFTSEGIGMADINRRMEKIRKTTDLPDPSDRTVSNTGNLQIWTVSPDPDSGRPDTVIFATRSDEESSHPFTRELSDRTYAVNALGLGHYATGNHWLLAVVYKAWPKARLCIPTICDAEWFKWFRPLADFSPASTSGEAFPLDVSICPRRYPEIVHKDCGWKI